MGDFGIDNPTYLLVAWALFAQVGRVMARWRTEPGMQADRTTTLDGLRGYLALSVFLHHGVIWYAYVRTGHWASPPSNLFRHLGETSVAFFFMITAYLFTRKLMDGRHRGIDWPVLYIHRVARLLPTYACAVLVVWGLAMAQAGWRLHVPPSTLVLQALQWLTFTVRGNAQINDVPDAQTLIAGVTWSLVYEWWFYLSLPLWAWLWGRRPALIWLLLAALQVATFHVFWGLGNLRLMTFVGGIAAALLVDRAGLRRFAQTRAASVVVIALVAAVVAFTRSPFNYGPTILLSIAFILVAAGTDVLGLLNRPSFRALGEITYSIYLWHGVLLAIVFRWGVGMSAAAALHTWQHWLLVILTGLVLLAVSWCSHRWIEVPGQRLGREVAVWWRLRGPATVHDKA